MQRYPAGQRLLVDEVDPKSTIFSGKINIFAKLNEHKTSLPGLCHNEKMSNFVNNFTIFTIHI